MAYTPTIGTVGEYLSQGGRAANGAGSVNEHHDRAWLAAAARPAPGLDQCRELCNSRGHAVGVDAEQQLTTGVCDRLDMR